MRIVFGVRHFKLKSYTLKELNLTEEDIDNVTIERRQNYFHLYWIPFFATGKSWALRKDDELYDLPAEYEAILEKKEIKHKTPYYTFAFPLLAVAGLIIYLLGIHINNYASEKRAQERFQAELADLNEKIATPRQNDFYELDGINNYSAHTYVKVLAVKTDSVLLQYPETKPSWYSSYSSGKLAAYFSEKPDNSNLTWVAINDLKKCIQSTYGDYSFKGNYLPITNNSINYRIGRIYHFEGPEFIDRGEGNMANNQITITLKNNGLTTTITEIKNVEGNVKWTTALPLMASANKKFTITGSYKEIPSYNIQITCTDSDSTVYKFELKGEGINRKLQQL
ncbi:MAG: hypothetical protein N4A49_14975 [Marinifilaceae bacterium]|jgi:hypothetical protein|nr:hypothetical protein [Marinifilaceae bacterium]